MIKRLICIFFTSLSILELLSFFFVYQSNKSLYDTLQALRRAGHSVVPNDHVLPFLEKIFPAFCSSLFILFTAGLFVSLILCFFALIFSKPAIHPIKTTILYVSVILSALMMSGLILFTLADSSIFLRTRDYLLLSNAPGRAINNFYYAYSPAAAQAITSPFQKPAKSCWIDPDIQEQKALARRVARFGWFTLPDREKACLIIKKSSDNHLLLQHKKKNILSVLPDPFLQNPGNYLKTYAEKTDPALFIRFLCSAGLFIGLPVFGISALFLLLFFISCKLMARIKALFLSVLLILGILVITLMYLTPVQTPDNIDEIQKMLGSQTAKTRIEALRILYHDGRDIWQFPDVCRTHVNSRSIAEKYWLAKCLSKSGASKSIPFLKQLITDDALNVKSAAITALSKISCNTEAIKIFKDLIQSSPDWYIQINADAALKGCQ